MSAITIRIRGNGIRRFKGYGPRLESNLDRALTQVAFVLKGEAQKLVQQGPLRTGRRRADGSTASAPGEPAKGDTGDLARSISASTSQRLIKRVGTFIKHGIYMEEGTRRIAERPYLRPTVENNKNLIIKIIQDAARRTT